MKQLLTYDWKFTTSNPQNGHLPSTNDSDWTTVRVPHDYAIEGPFAPENDCQFEEIVADGILTPISHIGRTGGLPHTTPAWYRCRFTVVPDAKHIFLQFDGVMANCRIYVNGMLCGTQHYGYTSFSVDVTKAVTAGENLLAVSLDPEESSSRWYPGAGIYRKVCLIQKQGSYFPYCPVFVRADVRQNLAFVDVDATVCTTAPRYDITYTLLNQAQNVVAEQTCSYQTASAYTVFKLDEFTCWQVLNSYLYTLQLTLTVNGIVQDSYQTTFGIRTVVFDPDRGLSVNGVPVKLNGVCMHHDLGALGAAFNRVAAKRQIEKLLSIGVNAYRTAHNPPAPEVLDLCDQYGLLVMDEAFDEWQIQKLKNGYGKYFDKDARDDLTAMIRRDRNHPCVILWSIGNEILEQRADDGWKVARHLHQICKSLDPTRKTTAGLSMTLDAFALGMAEQVDVAGINYKPHLYEQLHREYPHVVLYGSETASVVSSRGEYYQPATIEHPVQVRDSLQISSYDLSSPPWANHAEKEFIAQDHFDFLCGEFVWTGFDYLGEPTPHRNNWPSRSSYFGIFDLAGFEKSRAYTYRSRWTNQDVLYLFPHWNWTEGQTVDVHAYSSFDAVELFLNGQSLGVSVKDPTDELRAYRHIWEKILFQAGVLQAVAVEKPTITHTVRTAGAPHHIKLEAEQQTLQADGDDLLYVKCSVVDEHDILCPTACLPLSFTVSGAGEYLAADNGNAADDRTFAKPYCNTFNGLCVAIIRAKQGQTGAVTLQVSAEPFAPQTITVQAI